MTMCSAGSRGTVMSNAIDVFAVRACASVIVDKKFRCPLGVFAGTVTRYENTLSPGVTSPFVPLSKSCWVGDNPMVDRFVVTAIPVLGGLEAGVTLTVRREFCPGAT